MNVWLVCAETVAEEVNIYLKPNNDLKADKDEIE